MSSRPHDEPAGARPVRRLVGATVRRLDGATVPRLVVVTALLLAVAGAAVGAWWGERQSVERQATAVILLNPLQGNPFSPDARGDDLVNLETEAQLVTSDSVLDKLAATLPRAPVVTGDDVSVAVPPNTQLLSISVTGATDQEAEAATQALATLYLDYRKARTQSALFNQRANIDEQIQQRTTERSALVSRLDALEPGSPGSSLLTQQILAAVTQISELRTQLGEVGSVSLDPGQLVTPASASGGGLLPAGPWAPAGLGLLLGAVCGGVGAAQLSRRGDLVRGRDDLDDLDALCWGSIAASDRAGAARLRAVLLAARQGPTTVVLVCRAGPAGAPSGRRALATSCVESLATSLAAARLRTVLVDVGGHTGDDPRGGAAGLVDVVQGTSDPGSALDWDGELGRLGLGRDGAAFDDLVATPEMDAVLLELRATADLVLLHADAPASPRAQALAAGADLVVLEVPVGVVSLASLRSDLESLSRAGAGSIGLVLVSRDPRERGTPRPGEPRAGTPSNNVRPLKADPLERTQGRDVRATRRLARLARLARFARLAPRDAAPVGVRPREGA
ncbi:hypothetical protein [Nocardioides plantarum]|uniref:Uncharacterized protein n=1 Tax=Nocardioides plantarum TaxID=29299 RepID=A0ABV5KB91_9ACTN|nr:hypothetical protein [Nocardioides plantarum]